MSELPEFRFALFTDLHVGATRSNIWHNHFLSDEPERTVAATVEAVNTERPDFIAVLGDLSDNATADQLSLARSTLDRLEAPWIVCQGNHDVADGGDTTEFQRLFGDHAPVGLLESGVLPLPAGVVAAAFTARFGQFDGQWRAYAPDEQVQPALARMAALRPALLLVFWHFPLLRQSEHVRAFGGKNAGTLWNGDEVLANLAASAGATLVFTGHQHFHHIAVGAAPAPWLHCTTASLAEFPAEYRVVSVGSGGVSIRTAGGANQIVAAAAPPVVTWVAGRPEDREFDWLP